MEPQVSFLCSQLVAEAESHAGISYALSLHHSSIFRMPHASAGLTA